MQTTFPKAYGLVLAATSLVDPGLTLSAHTGHCQCRAYSITAGLAPPSFSILKNVSWLGWPRPACALRTCLLTSLGVFSMSSTLTFSGSSLADQFPSWTSSSGIVKRSSGTVSC